MPDSARCGGIASTVLSGGSGGWNTSASRRSAGDRGGRARHRVGAGGGQRWVLPQPLHHLAGVMGAQREAAELGDALLNLGQRRQADLVEVLSVQRQCGAVADAAGVGRRAARHMQQPRLLWRP